MYIARAKAINFRALRNADVRFHPTTNLIVGDNEVGKSTLLEAINLALTGQLYGRNIHYDLHPFLFNQDAVQEYVTALRSGEIVAPPSFEIELYFCNDDELADFKGTNNSSNENVPGLILKAELNSSYDSEYRRYIEDRNQVTTIPVELYRIVWRNFAGNDLSPRARPIKAVMIDTGDLRYSSGPQRYVLDQVSGFLDPADRAQLSLSYRRMKEAFQADENVAEINRRLGARRGEISDKQVSVSLDSTSKGSWESGIITNLDGIPFALVGKGEQSSVKIQLAMDAAAEVRIFLIEEPENHLSFTKLNRLVDKVKDKAENRQIFVTTHSSYVLNKLDVGQVLLFNGEHGVSLDQLSGDTRAYFRKLPGHDTLRMILASKVILVEGPSDELVVQRAILQQYGKTHLSLGVDIISVKSLAFKRFLEISALLNIPTRVITDNDGNIEALIEKYRDFESVSGIEICYGDDETLPSLEDQLVHSSGLDMLNRIFGKNATSDVELVDYMKKNKTECALELFDSDENFTVPGYIQHAIRELNH